MDQTSQNRKSIKKEKIRKIILYVILSVFLVTCIYPIIWLLINSFKTTDELFANTWGLPTAVREGNKDSFIGRVADKLLTAAPQR